MLGEKNENKIERKKKETNEHRKERGNGGERRKEKRKEKRKKRKKKRKKKKKKEKLCDERDEQSRRIVEDEKEEKVEGDRKNRGEKDKPFFLNAWTPPRKPSHVNITSRLHISTRWKASTRAHVCVQLYGRFCYFFGPWLLLLLAPRIRNP